MQLFAFAALTQVAAQPDGVHHHFEAHLKASGKSYEGQEYEARKANFAANFEKVRAHNEEYRSGKHSWWMKMNHFGDWTTEEFESMLMTQQHTRPSTHSLKASNSSRAEVPASIDWRTKGMVTPVKDQGSCGSCWAFSAIESVESRSAIATGTLEVLAPQAFVDCVENPNECGGTGGCSGATMELAFEVSTATGVPTEADYPYTASDGTCGTYPVAVKSTGYTKIAENDASALQAAVADGPVSVTVAASPWMFYGGGVFTGCSGSSSGAELNHGVQVVGYTDEYWITRNSWGSSWGEDGYIMVSRAADDKTFTNNAPADGVACKPYPKTQTVGGECGILFDTSYPKFDGSAVV